ncbi:hypothetical protein SLA2020_240370 [Shorea laevis]
MAAAVYSMANELKAVQFLGSRVVAANLLLLLQWFGRSPERNEEAFMDARGRVMLTWQPGVVRNWRARQDFSCHFPRFILGVLSL